MGRGDHLGELEALVLTSVARVEDEANGTAVYSDIESRTGRDPGLAAVHVTLRRLETKGLLSSRDGGRSPRGGRPRRFYRLTAEGVSELRAFREMWQRAWKGLRLPEPGESS